MYTQFFRLTQAPFSISPDPRYLFMSERHREALAHLLYGIDGGGGIVLLTGDIGTGKTTVCRCFLEQVPANCNVAYIFNPKLTVGELLQSVCEEFRIPLASQQPPGTKEYIDALNGFLLTTHAAGSTNVLIIDEAQNLSPEVLEQLRLLTNLETNERKLLQIILIGQPELRAMLARPELEQLAQRVIAHYHLTALSVSETAAYIQHRLAAAGLTTASPFPSALLKRIHQLTNGVPRRINLLCDRALLGAYARGTTTVDRGIVDKAAAELFVHRVGTAASTRRRQALLGLLAVAVCAGTAAWAMNDAAMRRILDDGWGRSTAMANAGWQRAIRLVSAKPAPEPAKPDRVIPVSRESAETKVLPPPARSTTPVVLKSEQAGLIQLARMWGVTLDGQDPCDAARSAGLRCYRSKEGFAELRELGRPAVLKLQERESEPYYAILTALGDNSATLHAANDSQTVSRLHLAQRFQGEFITLWRAPSDFNSTLGIGDEGAAVDWVREQLARLNGSVPPPAGKPYGPGTLKQVLQFQRAHGLHMDGIVGPITAMHLNRAAGVSEPHLQDVQVALQADMAEKE